LFIPINSLFPSLQIGAGLGVIEDSALEVVLKEAVDIPVVVAFDVELVDICRFAAGHKGWGVGLLARLRMFTRASGWIKATIRECQLDARSSGCFATTYKLGCWREPGPTKHSRAPF
jgi:hypothetical protein